MAPTLAIVPDKHLIREGIAASTPDRTSNALRVDELRDFLAHDLLLHRDGRHQGLREAVEDREDLRLAVAIVGDDKCDDGAGLGVEGGELGDSGVLTVRALHGEERGVAVPVLQILHKS